MKNYNTKNKIDKVETTKDTLTGRGGISLFVRYLQTIQICNILEERFGHLRKSRKGIEPGNLFKQILCFLFDGSSRHLTYFDKIKNDDGYAAAIENKNEEMVSSHAVKRFFGNFWPFCATSFRSVLKEMFVWRLHIDKPKIIELTIDSMVMNNDEAKKRHGVQPTYKKVKGFHPLQLIWNGKIVDAIFRGGKKSGNYGHCVGNMIKDIVRLIRKRYSNEVTIILRLDAGFFDEVNYKIFDELNIVFIATGKTYEWTKKAVEEAAEEKGWGKYSNGRQKWEYTEFDYKCGTWNNKWIALYTRPVYEENGQKILEFARPDNIIITNLKSNTDVLKYCTQNEKELMQSPEWIIANHHQRGGDELPHRGLKDFGFEQLPFKSYTSNTAFYYCMVIGFFLFETYKEDVLSEVLPVTMYASTARRLILDFAAKIVKTAHQIILKVPITIMEILRIDILWDKCNNCIPIRN